MQTTKGLGDSVYWLPWRYGYMTSATWQMIKNSGCNLFLTSRFTGCRLTVDSDRIAHTAHWVYPKGDASKPERNSSAARDRIEAAQMSSNPLVMNVRRRASFTTTNVGGGNISYDQGAAIGAGYKDKNGKWHVRFRTYVRNGLGANTNWVTLWEEQKH
ncbi:hypothetical protein [Pseudoalteromonas luteoviolacea]|uniref:hypothetical protein n=1 Tax=Pseudoalteromonas luteoviolacea TaxID=43657 RepID=UPI00114702BC|nr:hypothetical protein [Pseudoalteromonas luteoviolacea]